MFKQNLLTYISVSIVDVWKPCWTYLLPTNDDDDDDTRFELGECQLSRGEIFNPENLWKLMQVSFKRRWLSADIWTRLGGRMIIKTSGFRITCYVWQTLLLPVKLKPRRTNLNIWQNSFLKANVRRVRKQVSSHTLQKCVRKTFDIFGTLHVSGTCNKRLQIPFRKIPF